MAGKYHTMFIPEKSKTIFKEFATQVFFARLTLFFTIIQQDVHFLNI